MDYFGIKEDGQEVENAILATNKEKLILKKNMVYYEPGNSSLL